MRVHYIPILGVTILFLATNLAAAQSKRGTWAGSSATQQGSQPFTVVLDSGATGWKGAAVAPMTTSDSMRLVDVSVRADTLEFGIPLNGATYYVSGRIVGDKFSGQIWMGNTSVGSVQLTRKTPAEKPNRTGELKPRTGTANWERRNETAEPLEDAKDAD